MKQVRGGERGERGGLFICGPLKFIVYEFKRPIIQKKVCKIGDRNPPFVVFEPVLVKNAESINETWAGP